jgi:Zn-dependent protease with chaperone function
VRAKVSVALLAGFVALVGLQLCLVVGAVLLALALLPGEVAARVGVPVCTATVGVTAYATWRALRRRSVEPAGVPVGRDDAPALWALLDRAVAAAGTRPPDGVTVVAGAVATLHERARLLGLVGGRRTLYLGLPLLQAWDPPGVAAAAAHELAHGSPRLDRWAPVAYRGRRVLGRVVPRISRRNPAGPLLRAYGELYRRVDAPFSRAQEQLADRVAAEVAGPAAAAAVLRDLPALQAAQRLFHAEYVGPGWQAGHVPEDLFGGFLRVLAARAGDVARLRHRDPAPPGRWDTHPPPAARLAALEGVEPGAAPPAGWPAELVPDLPGLGRAVQAVAYPPHGRTTAGWDAFFTAARTAELRREADGALAALSRAAGAPVGGPADVLGLAADGRLGELVAAALPDAPEEPGRGVADPGAAAERVCEVLTLVLALAALDSGAARWRHSWTGTAELVGADGGHLDLGALAALAGDARTVGAARERLAALGIDLGACGEPAPEGRGEVVGGVVNLVVDGSPTDLLIVDTGLLLVPGLPRSRNGSAKRRLAEFAAADVAQRVTAAPGTRFVPYGTVAGATRTRRARRAWDLSLRDGGTLSVRARLDSDELPGGWAALEDAVAYLSRARRPAPG